MFWNHWLSRFAACELSNTRVTKRRTGTRSVDPSLPVAAQVLELEARVLPATFVVTTTADIIDPDDGVISLREAIIQANTNAVDDIIQLAAGTYTLTLAGIGENAAATGDLDILNNSGVTIVGVGANQTVISAGGLLDRLFHVHSFTSLTLEGVTITGGSQVLNGGGIYSAGTLTISNSTIRGNSVFDSGGAIHNDSGTLTITNSTISENFAGNFGGGVHSLATVIITNSTISGNIANNNGGGLHNNEGSLSVTGSTISDNMSRFDGSGGGIYNMTGPLTVTRSTISGNSAATAGGGIANLSGSLTLADSTLSGNSADLRGGGIDISQGSGTITNTTISGNLSLHIGGGLSTQESTVTVANSTLFSNRSDIFGENSNAGGAIHVPNGTLTLRNTIAVGNFLISSGTAHDVTGTLAGGSAFNLIGDSGSAGGLTNGNNGNIVGVSAAGVLSSSLANNGGPTLTHALVAGSPAIDAGDPAFNPNTLPFDQRGTGFDRVLQGRIDIGAVESPAGFVNTVPSLVSNPNTTTFSKKAAKKNPFPQVLPNINVFDPDPNPGQKLGGGTLTFSLNMPGKATKKGFVSYDTLTVVPLLIGNITGPTQNGDRIEYQVALDEGTTAGNVTTFLRFLTFSTKGKGVKVATRLFRVQVTDSAGAVSNLIEQTINVGK